MDNQSRVGIFVMVVSIVLAITFFVISDNSCLSADFSWQVLSMCYGLRMFPDEIISYLPQTYGVDIPVKYLLLFCIFVFAAGFLIKKNVIVLQKKPE